MSGDVEAINIMNNMAIVLEDVLTLLEQDHPDAYKRVMDTFAGRIFVISGQALGYAFVSEAEKNG